jgi:hypothetical protein
VTDRMKGTRAPIIDTIRRAQQAQQDHEQAHDVQLSVLPFYSEGDHDSTEWDFIWANEDEKAQRRDTEIDEQWDAWWYVHPLNHNDPPKEP